MWVFIYEHLTATGFGRDPDSPDHAIYREGRAMRNALAADFAKIPGVDVVTFPDGACRCTPEDMVLFATGCNWTVVIAPELDGILEERIDDLRRNGCRVLASTAPAIALASDKLVLAEHWHTHDIRTPATTEREPTACEASPVVWKPRNGTARPRRSASTRPWMFHGREPVLDRGPRRRDDPAGVRRGHRRERGLFMRPGGNVPLWLGSC